MAEGLPRPTQEDIFDSGEVKPEEIRADGPGWLIAQEGVAAHTWRTLGVFDFGEQDVLHILVGIQYLSPEDAAVGKARLEDVDLWCPAVRGAWVSISDFPKAAEAVTFRGPVAVWTRNRTDSDLVVDVRFHLGKGERLPPVDLTAPYYASNAWRETHYRGTQVLKCPLDLWVMQEIFHEVRPDAVIETGTFKGGSALYYADLLEDIHEDGPFVISIDVEEYPDRPAADGLTYIKGSSTDPAVLAEVRRLLFDSWNRTSYKQSEAAILVVLDSDHSYDHVLAELRAWSPLVSVGSYLVCEDTNTPGPAEAVKDFLASPEGRGFDVDRSRERHGLTFNPGGYLRRRA